MPSREPSRHAGRRPRAFDRLLGLDPAPRTLIAWSAVTVALLAVLRWLDGQLLASGAGIVDFEMACDALAARQVVDGWRSHGVAGKAVASLVVDLPFLCAYSTSFALAALALGRRLATLAGSAAHGWLRGGGVVAALAWVAADFDLVENAALGAILGGSEAQWLAPLACWAARVKFGLLGVVAVALVGALLVWLARRRQAQPAS